MRTLAVLLLWFILFVLCWPLALAALFLFPIIWLILLPFRIVGLTIGLLFKFLEALFLFPFKVLRSI
jgi:hypothetical protein